MVYRVSTPENSIVDFRAGRTRYDYDSYFDTLDTEISELLTVPVPTELRIEAANWQTIADSDGSSKYPNTKDEPWKYLVDSYYPDGNATNFNYLFMAGEHAVFYVRNIQPERNLFTYRWEIDGNVKSEGPSLTLYNLRPDIWPGEGDEDDGSFRGAYPGFGQKREVVCIATNKNGKEIRQSLSYKCDEFVGIDGILKETNRNKLVDGLWQKNRRNSYKKYLEDLASSAAGPGGGGGFGGFGGGSFGSTLPVTSTYGGGSTSTTSSPPDPTPPVYEFDAEIFYDESLPNSIRYRPLKETTFEDA